jgi:CRISPR-associated protein Cas5h
MQTLVFDIWGEWGHFRKYYSTSSPLTFSVLPPTAAYGILGAVLGLSKENNAYLVQLKEAHTHIGIGLVHPVKKIMLGLNLINTKGNVWVPKQRREGARTQIRTEFLKDARFRLFVAMDNEDMFTKLVSHIKDHKTYYTVSLGLSELLANFQYVDEIDGHWKISTGHPVKLDTIVPLTLIRNKGVRLVPGKRYKKERLPLDMDENRIVSAYEECLFDMNGQAIEADVTYYYEGTGKNGIQYRYVFLNEHISESLNQQGVVI